jgi:phosphonatase-like hydrolase
MIKMVVFDMAGTTVDEQNVVYKTLQRAINEAGFEMSLDEVLQHGAGKEKMQAIVDILQDKHLEKSELEAIYNQFVLLLDEAYQNLAVLPQPGAIELFKFLKERDIKVVLNTGYNQETAEKLLGKLGWQIGREFDALITASQIQASRPKPDMILLAMSQLGIEHGADVAKVGDSIIDIEEGKNAGCGLSIGITTGAHSYEQLQSAHPNFIIDSLLEIKNLL